MVTFNWIMIPGKPAAPSNCAIHNQTADSVRVDCQEAFDGGLQQTFGLELVDRNTRTLRYVFNNTKPVFTVYGLVGCIFFLFLPGQPLIVECFVRPLLVTGTGDGLFAQYLRPECQRAQSTHHVGDDNSTSRSKAHR